MNLRTLLTVTTLLLVVVALAWNFSFEQPINKPELTAQLLPQQSSDSDSLSVSENSKNPPWQETDLKIALPIEQTKPSLEPLPPVNTSDLESIPIISSQSVLAQPLWNDDDVIDKDSNHQSEWISLANVLAIVNLPKNLPSRLQVGSSFILPVGERPEYQIEQEKRLQGQDEESISWLAVNTKLGEAGNRYGVISRGRNVLLMTLYTDRGVYYVRSDNNTTAEVSFVDYATLKLAKNQKEKNKLGG